MYFQTDQPTYYRLKVCYACSFQQSTLKLFFHRSYVDVAKNVGKVKNGYV